MLPSLRITGIQLPTTPKSSQITKTLARSNSSRGSTNTPSDGDSSDYTDVVIELDRPGKRNKTLSVSKAKNTTSTSTALSTDVQNVAPVLFARELPKVLILHTGGTLGMDPEKSFETDIEGHRVLRQGTGGSYNKVLKPGNMLSNLLAHVPELSKLAQINIEVVFNLDSSNVGPPEWVKLARTLHKNRNSYDAFIIIHGTDTMSYTAAALSLMLAGFRKPIVMTGSQIPLSLPRSDAKQNLLDALTCATSQFYPPHVALQEVAICFGGKLLRGNRAQKWNSSIYQAFDSPSYPALAALGVDVEWNKTSLLQPQGVYKPRFELDSRVIRVPIVPGSNPSIAYGNLFERGIRGIVLESYGVGNMPDLAKDGWLAWLKQQRKQGLQIYMRSQSSVGPLHPELYKAGSMALKLGVEAGPQMTPECAAVKMMFCLKYPDIPIGMPLAGEL